MNGKDLKGERGDLYQNYGYGSPQGAPLIVGLKYPKVNPETGTPMVMFVKSYKLFRRSSKDGTPAGGWWIQFYLNPRDTKIDVKEDNVAFIKER